jgi:hypothetical protein
LKLYYNKATYQPSLLVVTNLLLAFNHPRQ